MPSTTETTPSASHLRTAPPAVALRGVTKSFSDSAGGVVRAVDGIDLTIMPGEIVAFLGPNGAGKTTTLDMVLGFTTPDSGTVDVVGMSPRAAVQAGRVGAVLQTGGLLRDITVEETVRLISGFYPSPQPVSEVMEQAGIAELAKRKVSKCSGGEQQRLRFALALLPDPDLLILDEPTAGMDVGARHHFWETMHRTASEGRTVIFATHYLEEAEAFAKRTVFVARGRIVADGATSEIRDVSRSRKVSADVPDVAEAVRRIEALAGVGSVTHLGQRVTASVGDSDAVAKLLLVELGGSALEVSAPSLEEAFIALTGSPDDPGESSVLQSARPGEGN